MFTPPKEMFKKIVADYPIKELVFESDEEPNVFKLLPKNHQAIKREAQRRYAEELASLINKQKGLIDDKQIIRIIEQEFKYKIHFFSFEFNKIFLELMKEQKQELANKVERYRTVCSDLNYRQYQKQEDDNNILWSRFILTAVLSSVLLIMLSVPGFIWWGLSDTALVLIPALCVSLGFFGLIVTIGSYCEEKSAFFKLWYDDSISGEITLLSQEKNALELEIQASLYDALSTEAQSKVINYPSPLHSKLPASSFETNPGNEQLQMSL